MTSCKNCKFGHVDVDPYNGKKFYWCNATPEEDMIEDFIAENEEIGCHFYVPRMDDHGKA